MIIWRTWVQKDRGKSLLTMGIIPKDGKAVRGFWYGSSKINGRSGCGFVIKCVDINKWIQQNQGILGHWYGYDCRSSGCLCLSGHIKVLMQFSGIIECGLRAEEDEK